MHILQVYTHAPESCPIGNPKNLQITMDWLKRVDMLAAKHNIKVIGIWVDRWGHQAWAVYDTPNMEAFEAFEQEPEHLKRVSFTDTQTKIVTTCMETISFFERIQKEH
ncbi:MAG: hypothetical protein LBH74_06555 [Nitrososphaerota archaeon]|jgi:hypothetical protein|nr:hypothetical protein [Nitrososphaerota archaeon]